MRYITFNDKLSTDPLLGIGVVQQIRRPILPDTNERFTTITGKDGVYDRGRDRKEGYINLRFWLNADNFEDRILYADRIATWLTTDAVKPLIISDQPTKRYMARIAGSVSIDGAGTDGHIDAVFVIPSSFKEGESESTIAESFGTNSGTAPTPCVLTLSASAGESVKVTSDQTGEYVQITDTFVGGEVIRIDTETHYVTIDDVDSRSKVIVSSTYFDLLPGNWSITVTGCAITSVVYREKYL